MLCKLCNKHLYETISFQTLFKWSFDLHVECEQKRRQTNDFIAVPVDQGLVLYDYLFQEGHQDADRSFLFTKYMGEWFKKAIEYNNRSTIVLFDEMNDISDLQLVVPLSGESVILFSMFDTTLVSLDETEKKF